MERTKTRFVFARHRDSFDGLKDQEGPNWVEFNLYEIADPPDPFRNAFFHLDFYTLEYLKSENVEEAYPEEIASRAKQAHLSFLYGKEEYIVDLLFYPSAASRFYGGPLPLGKTLFDLTHLNEKPVYAYLYVREHAPLTPSVLCRWLERLSIPLFGDAARYELKE